MLGRTPSSVAMRMVRSHATLSSETTVAEPVRKVASEPKIGSEIFRVDFQTPQLDLRLPVFLTQLKDKILASVNDVSYDFHETVDSKLWSAARVQKELSRVITECGDNENLKVFPVIYKAMTAARDLNRLTGGFSPSGPCSDEINNRLADIMTRHLVSEYDAFRAGGRPETDSPINRSLELLQSESVSNIGAAIEVVLRYIGSHLAVCLAAIAHDQDFWENVGPTNTHGTDQTSLDARMELIRKYQPTFDQFNEFLAENFDTVGKALFEAELIDENSYNLFLLLDKIPLRSVPIGFIRNLSFETGCNLATTWGPDEHPLVTRSNDVYTIDPKSSKQYQWSNPLEFFDSAMSRASQLGRLIDEIFWV